MAQLTFRSHAGCVADLHPTTATGRRRPASGSTTDQAKDKARKEQAQQAAGQAQGRAAHARSTSARPRPASGSAASPPTCAASASSCASRARTSPRSSPSRPRTAPSSSATTCSDTDADRILGDIEDFGRRQPWAVIAGGVALGLVASRFLKASSTRRYEQRYERSRAAAVAHLRPVRPASRTRGTPCRRAPAPPTRRRRPPAPAAVDAGRASRGAAEPWPISRTAASGAHAAGGVAATASRRPRAPDRRAGQGPLRSRPRRWSARRSSSPRRSCRRRARSPARARACSPAPPSRACWPLGALTAALIALLDKAMATWVAALIVMALWAVVALVLAKAGQKALKQRHAAGTSDCRNREGGHPVGQEPDRIRAEIEQTRAEMSETVDALGYKADVKSRAKENLTRQEGFSEGEHRGREGQDRRSG